MKKKSFLISAFGVMAQYYDHHLLGYLAATISKSFVPSSDPKVALLKTYFIMTIAVFAKPVGALCLGRIGDIYGRSATLKISLIGTSLASLLISVTPGYHYIGIVAALILLLARMIIVSLVSSGTDGVRLYVYEQIGKKKQCLGNGLVTCFCLSGSFVASMSAWFFTLDYMPHYAWRLAFMLGTMFGIIMFAIVHFNKQSDILATKEDPKYDEYLHKSTFKIIFENFWLFICCAILAGSLGSTNHFCLIFFGTYIFGLLEYVDNSVMQFYTSLGIIIYMVSAIAAGLLADLMGRKLIASIGFVALFTCSVMMLFAIKSGYMPVAGYFAMLVSLPMLTMPALAFLKQSIPKVIRYRIFSFAHAVGSICISSPTPFYSTLMYKVTGIGWAPMVYFLIISIAIISMIYVLCTKYKANEY